jgi:RNA polymerase sigma factor (sigma-70 family)
MLTDGRNGESDLIVAELFSEKQERLQQGINRLPTRQKEVIRLKFYEGMSNETIAKVMEIERQTVANFLYRALATLKSTIQTPTPA